MATTLTATSAETNATPKSTPHKILNDDEEEEEDEEITTTTTTKSSEKQTKQPPPPQTNTDLGINFMFLKTM